MQKKISFFSLIFGVLFFGVSYAAVDIPSYYFSPTSSYTAGWGTFSCPGPWSYQVLAPGTDTIPVSLTANTIYLLDGGLYNTTSTKFVAGDCVAVIGLGSVIVSGAGAAFDMFDVTSRNQVVFDNLKVLGGTNGFNLQSSTNITLNSLIVYQNFFGVAADTITALNILGSQFYSNTSDGINFNLISTGKIYNNQIYNNQNRGIFLTNSSRLIFHNNQVFNNIGDGIAISTNSSGNALNNNVVYNNGGVGVNLSAVSASNNILNSLVIYNNGGSGLSISSANNLINNIISFNNASGGVTIPAAASNNRWYGTITSYSNGASDDTGGLVQGLAADSTGTALSWTNGSLSIVGTVTCADMVNPSGLLVGSCNQMGRQTWTPPAQVSYSFGSTYSTNNIQQPIVSFASPFAIQAVPASTAIAFVNPFYVNTVPNSFSYTAVYGAATGTITTGTNSAILAGLTSGTILHVTGASVEWTTGGGVYSSGPVVVFNGDVLSVRLLSSVNTGSYATGFITVGGFSTQFLVATIPLVAPPSGGGGGSIFFCGNGYVEGPAEECDDGNQINGDGCSKICRRETTSVCGNGTLERGEQCDDGNTTGGDGCSAACLTEGPGSLTGNFEPILTGGGTGKLDPGVSSYYDGLSDLIGWYASFKDDCDYNDEDYHDLVFSDIEGNRYQDNVETLLNYCIIKGVANQRFDIDSSADRSQFVKMMIKLSFLGQKKHELNEKTKYTGPLYYKDIMADDWFSVYVAKAKEYGLLSILDKSIKDKGMFLPYRPVTKPEVIQTIRVFLSTLKIKNTVFEAAVSRMSSQQGVITRGELVWLLQYAFGLKYDQGRIMRSRNAEFLMSLQSSLAGIPNSQQKKYLQDKIAMIQGFDSKVVDHYQIYKVGLIADLQRVLKKEKRTEIGFVFTGINNSYQKVENPVYNPSPNFITGIDVFVPQPLEVKIAITIPTKFVFYRTFKLNQKAIDVSYLQLILQQKGYYTGSVNSQFDRLTMDSLSEFQTAMGIINSNTKPQLRGYFGSATRKSMNQLLKDYR